jgi:hypothetical protein
MFQCAATKTSMTKGLLKPNLASDTIEFVSALASKERLMEVQHSKLRLHVDLWILAEQIYKEQSEEMIPG